MATQEQIKKVQDMARTIRLHVLDMIGGKEGKVGHLGGSFSCADIMAALYFYKMRVNPQNPKDPGRDRMLMSKGHAVLAQYAALAELGYFPMEELQHVKCCGAASGYDENPRHRGKYRFSRPGPVSGRWHGCRSQAR